MAKKQIFHRFESFLKILGESKEIPPFAAPEDLQGWTWECDSGGFYKYCSPEIETYLGLSPNMFQGQQVSSFRIHPESGTHLQKILIENNFPYETEIYFNNRNNEWVLARIHLFKQINEEDGGFHGFTQLLPQTEEMEISGFSPDGSPLKEHSEILEGPVSFFDRDTFTNQNIDVIEEPRTEAGRESIITKETVIRSAESGNPASIAIPFFLGKSNSGIIEIIDDNDKRIWRDDEILLVKEVANQLSNALENAQLDAILQQELSERIKAEQEILHRAQDLAKLNQIGQQLSKLVTQEELFEIIYNAVGRIFDNQNLIIAIYHPDRETIWYPIFLLDGNRKSPTEVPLGNGIPAYIIRKKSPLLVTQDVMKSLVDNRIDPPERLPKSILGIPMLAGDKPIGAIILQDFNNESAYNSIHVDLLFTIASQATIAINNVNAYDLLEKALEDLKELDRMKSQFLANISHELKTPLNSIIGFSKVIMNGIDGPINDIQKEDLNAIFNSGQHLLNLINDILDLSKIEAGKMDLSISEVDIFEIVESVISTALGLVKDKPIKLKHKIEDNLPIIKADPIRIRQVLLNLLSNAAKFTDEGSIELDVKKSTDIKGIPEILVTVKDTGPGISPEDQVKLFQPFFQVDGSPNQKTGGTGLGLSICRSLIEMHHGKIGVQSSEVGKGSTFYFTLPIDTSIKNYL